MQGQQEFIVGNAGAFYRGRAYKTGQAIVLKEGDLPSETWRWPNGAPVEFEKKWEEKLNDRGQKVRHLVSKELKKMGAAPPGPKVPTEEERIAALEEEVRVRKEALKAKHQPALSQVKNPPKSPGVDDGNAAKPHKSSRPSDQDQ